MRLAFAAGVVAEDDDGNPVPEIVKPVEAMAGGVVEFEGNGKGADLVLL